MTRRGFAKRCSIWMAGKRHRASESSRVTHEGERMWRWLYDCRHAWDSAAPLSSREGALELPQRTRVHALRRRPRVSLTASRTRSFCVCPRRSLVSRDCLMSLEAHFCQSFSQQLVSRPVASSQNGRNCQYTCASFLRDSCGRRFPWHTNASECILWRGRGRKQLCSLFLGFVCHRSCSVHWEATRVRCFSWWSTGKWVNHKAAP